MQIGRDGRRQVVRAADAAAQGLGLRPGLAATQAHALVADLQTHDADAEGDARALERLAAWAMRRYAPIVAADPPDGIAIEASGAAHLHGGEGAMLADMVGRLAAAGIRARAAMAATYGAAHAIARHRGEPLLVIGAAATADILANLPVAALRLPGELVIALGQLGFDRIGELAAQPRAPLALRFGPAPGRRLDQAFGRLAEPIAPLRLPDLIEAGRDFAEPIGAPETIARFIGLLAAELCAALEARSLGARRLDLLFHRVDSQLAAIRIGTVRPARDAKRLARLLCDRLETIDPGFGIERMVLSAPVAEPLNYTDAANRLADAPVADISGLLDTLAGRVGAGQLYRLAAVESDVPERSVRRVDPLSPPTKGRWPLNWPRPTRLLRRPEAIETLAVLPDHPPVHFTWRGTRRQVKRADGPERIYGEWGRRDAELSAVRDYFQVEDEAGGRYWLFRAGDGEDPETGSHRWFLHGIFG